MTMVGDVFGGTSYIIKVYGKKNNKFFWGLRSLAFDISKFVILSLNLLFGYNFIYVANIHDVILMWPSDYWCGDWYDFNFLIFFKI